MKGAKRAKSPKKVKAVKMPKKAVKEKLTKEEKRLVKKTKKDLIKKGKMIDKSVGRAVSILAIFLCLISSVLDVLIREKNKTEHEKNN